MFVEDLEGAGAERRVGASQARFEGLFADRQTRGEIALAEVFVILGAQQRRIRLGELGERGLQRVGQRLEFRRGRRGRLRAKKIEDAQVTAPLASMVRR